MVDLALCSTQTQARCEILVIPVLAAMSGGDTVAEAVSQMLGHIEAMITRTESIRDERLKSWEEQLEKKE